MKIRNALLAAGAALALSGLATGALASGTVSATANATATVISPTTITKTQDMNFGTVVRPTSGGTNTVTLDANNTVTMTGPGNGSVVTSPTTSAKFNIAVQTATNYTLAQTLTFTQSGLTNITPGTAVATTGTLGTIAANGAQEIRYGGSFDIGIATPIQNYTGTLSVTVTYN
ncbi:MAG TPA: DUF4402 domain-containing protein [Phenylobacterium sp.]|jgi:hypothetical protein|uniref:DUF4402 domain-containing protein n=1 Tax=Phenylobacterium sp. TaxID=1871053 RepID=UPI002CA34441|nr:DUF4402 domain-containing protein [Phenylobacterium sp.]HXA39758.1 DUF4402 domain-containing protein [Phenylobacterium sp.]